MNALWWLVLGLLIGWFIELAIDYFYWRKQARIVTERQAARAAELDQRAAALDVRQVGLDDRESALNEQQTKQNTRDAELLALARQLDERSDEYTRLEQQLEKRRSDIDRMGLALTERERDIGARHETLKAQETDAAERMKQLSANEQDVARRMAVVSNRESAMSSWESRILAREREVADREAVLARDIAEAESMKTGYARLSQLLGRTYFNADGSDDLEAIEGIGPKIAGLLHGAGIRSFERLAETPVGELTRILEAAGPRFGLADPMTWAEQASLIQQGEYLAFEDLKVSLVGGVRQDADTLPGASGASGASERDSGNERDGGNERDSGNGPDVVARTEPALAIRSAIDETVSAGDTTGVTGLAETTAATDPVEGGELPEGIGLAEATPAHGPGLPEAARLASEDDAPAADVLRSPVRSDGPLFDGLDEAETAPAGADPDTPDSVHGR